MSTILRISLRFLPVAVLIAVSQDAGARIETPGARSVGPFPSGAVASYEAQLRKVAPAFKSQNQARGEAHSGKAKKGFHPFAGLRSRGKTATKAKP